MNLKKLKSHLDRGDVRPAYLICGDDESLKKKALHLLDSELSDQSSDIGAKEQIDTDEATGSDVLDLLSTPPLLGGSRIVIVPEADRLPDLDVLQQHIDDPPGFSVLILTSGKKAREIKLAKSVKNAGGLLEFVVPQGNDLKARLRQMADNRGLTLDAQAMAVLEERVGDDLLRAESELDKLRSYIGNSDRIEDRGDRQLDGRIDKALAERIISTGQSEAGRYALFNYVDAVSEGQTKKALEHLEELIAAGESPLAIIGMIARQFRLLIGGIGWQADRPENLAQAMGMKSAFPAKKAINQARSWQLEAIERALEQCIETDLSIKRGMDGRMALELLTVRLILDQRARHGARLAGRLHY